MSEFEKQVYLPPNKLNVLTDQRVISIMQMRPIDNLVMVLNHLAKLGHDVYHFDELENFMETYSVRETCAMLVQVITEPEAKYLFSAKIDKALESKTNSKKAVS